MCMHWDLKERKNHETIIFDSVAWQTDSNGPDKVYYGWALVKRIFTHNFLTDGHMDISYQRVALLLKM